MDHPLSSFFEKFISLYRENKDRKHFFIESAGKEGISLSEGEFSISGTVVALAVSAAKKNELFLKKEKILGHFNTKSQSPLTAIR